MLRLVREHIVEVEKGIGTLKHQRALGQAGSAHHAVARRGHHRDDDCSLCNWRYSALPECQEAGGLCRVRSGCP